MTHSIISPAILYFGSPVVLVSSENEDGTDNICAISSAFWLAHRCILGFLASSKTPLNILRTGQCVVNLPDDSMAGPINALASTTGTEHLDAGKIDRGYRYVKDKWTCAGLTPMASDFVRPARIRESPVHMECELVGTHDVMQDLPDRAGFLVVLELRVLRIHVRDEIRMAGTVNRIDPDKWRPMIMSFQELYGLSSGKMAPSQLGKVEEEKYRALTRSDQVELPGDADKELVERSKLSRGSIVAQSQ